MAKRKIVILGEDEILQKKCRRVEKFDDKLCALLDDMAETMYDAVGAGLAAPQVGLLRRIAVIDVGDGLIELINPEIIAESGVQEEGEGCLSVPGKRGITRRPAKVKVRAMDRHGKIVEYKGSDLLARAFCHELDHLDGELFIDPKHLVRYLDPDEVG